MNVNETEIRIWARVGARLAVIAALDTFPELAAEFGITKTDDVVEERPKRRPARTARTFTVAGKKAISNAAKKRWAGWRKQQRRKESQ